MSLRSKFSRENSVSSAKNRDLRQQQPAVVESQQRFFEASMKLGGKALVNSQTGL